MTAPQSQNEQLELQGLLWAAPTLGLCPGSPSQELSLTQKTDPILMRGLQATYPCWALPPTALPQKPDHDVFPREQCWILPATQDLLQMSAQMA